MPIAHRVTPVSRALFLAVVVVLGSTSGPRTGAGQGAIHRAFQDLWAASDSGRADAAVDALLDLDLSFDSALHRLRVGRDYTARVATGRIDLSRVSPAGMERHYTIVVPEGYDHQLRYPVRVFLHGGVEREGKRRGGSWRHDRYSGADWIAVFPSGWRDAMWWFENQVENVMGILGTLRQTYNVDENRVHLFGVSDGGTGAYFFGMKAATPWAGILPLLGHPSVLANPRVQADGQLYVVNLRNVPLLVVNGALDPMYPAHRLEPYVALYREAGIDATFRDLKNVGHNMSWWEAESENIASFIRDHPRDPLPDSVTWETERIDRYNRASWVVVSELGEARDEATLPDFNSVAAPEPRPALGVGVEDVAGQGVRLTRINDGSVAQVAGLRPGDIVVSVDGVQTPTEASLIAQVRDIRFGSRVQLSIERDGARRPITVVYPPPPPPEEPYLVFPHFQPSGRIEVVRRGNSVEVKTNGIRTYRLLLSADRFDLQEPVTVRTNGHASFEGVVNVNTETLLRWAARDHDRTMLFAAELDIRLPASTP